MNSLRSLCLLLFVALSGPGIPAHAADAQAPFALEPSQLQADYWSARLSEPDRPLLDATQLAAFNARSLQHDPSLHDLQQLPEHYPAADVRQRVQALSTLPKRTLYDPTGHALDAAQSAALIANLALDAIPAQVTPRYALVIQRAPLRTFPTRQRVFSTRDDHDIDRFQESALYPGTAVAILHDSRDGQWSFVLAPNYAAWIERSHVAEAGAADVLAYARRSPRLIVTGATAQTVFTPELPAASRITLDMGSSLPLLTDWSPQQAVNGQLPLAARVVQLPTRDDDGRLRLVAALIPRSADAATATLPVTPRALLHQAFKFLGERYGWGNDYDARDCSGFVSDVYRSLGVTLPRNTGDQARSSSLAAVPYDAAAPLAQRRNALARLQPGDLVYIPGHVMMVIGHDRGQTWVIHDVAGAGYRDSGGELQRAHLNGVSVTPLEPLLLGGGKPFIEHISRIQRLRPIAHE